MEKCCSLRSQLVIQAYYMNLKKGQIVELAVERIAFGGAGIAKYNGLTVFVKETMPGDVVEAAFRRIKPNYAEAELVKIVQPSRDRVQPRCPYSGTCGGCQIMYMPYEKQLEFKKQNVIDSFERIGKIYNPPVADIIGSRDIFYYRNKMEFTFGYDEAMNFTFGLHLPERKFDILDVHECYLQSELSAKIVNAVRDFMKARGWLPFKYSNGEGFLKALYIRDGKRTGEVMINLVTSDQMPADAEEGIKKFMELIRQFKEVVSIYWTQVISRRGVRKQFKETLLHGKPAIVEKMILQNGDEMSFVIAPQAFFQVNTFQAEILYSQVVKLALQKPQNVIFDLFCGTGTIGLFLAKHAEQVVGIELNEEAVKSARENASRNAIFNIDFYTGEVNKVLSAVRQRPSLVVVDPPRIGLNEKLIAKISDFGANQLIYVSCNPATLARDCAWLKAYGFAVKQIQPVDMFPHSFHIENVCLLERF